MNKYNLIDFDGCLVDTRSALYGAYSKAFNSYGLALTADELDKFAGRSINELFLQRNIPQEICIGIKKMKAEIYPGFYSQIILTKELSELSNKIIISNASSTDIKKIISILGVIDIIEVFGREELGFLKPNLLCYKKIYLKYGLENTYAIYDDLEESLDVAAIAAILSNMQQDSIELIKVNLNEKQKFLQYEK